MDNDQSKQILIQLLRYANYELSFVRDGAASVRHDDTLPGGILALAAVCEDEVTLRLAALVAVVVEPAHLVGTPHRGAAARIVETELAALRGALAIGSIIRVAFDGEKKWKG